jgi:hypothetical protein
MPYWVTFDDGSKGCVELQYRDQDLEKLVNDTMRYRKEFRKFKSAAMLPYPADPRLITHYDADWDTDRPVACPSFCYTPEECKGQSSCRKNPCCTE